jgi:hypothetical protein
VLYTATGNDNLAITGVGFQPDFTWIKSRSATYSHNVYDGVRGVSKRLQPNLTNAESSISGVKSFDADGFTLGNSTNDTNFTSGITYVAWNWKANGSGVSNTDGSITSTVSANTDAGFSIVSYTGTGSNLTVGHGLNEAPDMVIIKGRDFSDFWWVGHNDIGSGWTGTDYIALNGTYSYGWDGNRNTWTGAPTSTVVKIGTDNIINRNGNDFIMYAFHSVDGFSKFGSYTGNGSTDGPFVYTGFRPAWIVTKRTDSTSNWTIIDAKREGFNASDGSSSTGNDGLDANNSGTEGSADQLDILSNGWKRRDTSTSGNASGATYIYMAFAENPFKYANAR